MSQLFYISFKRFYYDSEDQYELHFEDSDNLPFEVLEDDGQIFVDKVSNLGLNLSTGLRITKINDITIDDITIDQFNTLIRKRKDVTILFCEEICGDDMSMYKSLSVLNDNVISNSAQKGCSAYQAIMDNESFWKPKLENNNHLSFLQIDLENIKQIRYIKIKGNQDHSMYLTSLWIDISNNGCEWKSYLNQEIKCNYNRDNVAIINIWPIVQTRFIRIRPQKWHNKIALKFEIFGLDELSQNSIENAVRVITLNDVDIEQRKYVLEQTKHVSTDRRLIQVDCKAVIQMVLERVGIDNANMSKSSCTFCSNSIEQSEQIINHLSEFGVGKEFGQVQIINIEQKIHHQKQSLNPRSKTSARIKLTDSRKSDTFAKSIKSRKLVQEMIKRVENSARLTFDYIILVIVASMIAVGGLATNNQVIVVASMLVSPIMGPVLSLTFGATLNEWKMAKIGLRNEVISLMLCIITGFIVGLCYTLSTAGSRDWPTTEMLNRGSTGALGDGFFIAAVSGVGVALSVSGDYLSAIIGVAISASLLPPAVNSGMLGAHALWGAMNPNFQPIAHRKFSASEIFEMSAWSFLLTIENIIVIFLVSLAMFKIKEVVKIKDEDKPIWKSVKHFKLKKRLKQTNTIQNVKRTILRANFYSNHSTLFGGGTEMKEYNKLLIEEEEDDSVDQKSENERKRIDEIFVAVSN